MQLDIYLRITATNQKRNINNTNNNKQQRQQRQQQQQKMAFKEFMCTTTQNDSEKA